MSKIYLLRNGEGMYKLGRTKQNLRERVKQLQTGSSSAIDMIDEYEVKNASQVEAIMHRSYRAMGYGCVGEWFDLPIDKVANFRNEVKQTDERIEFLRSMENPFI